LAGKNQNMSSQNKEYLASYSLTMINDVEHKEDFHQDPTKNS
jgi:hypothetical protein